MHTRSAPPSPWALEDCNLARLCVPHTPREPHTRACPRHVAQRCQCARAGRMVQQNCVSVCVVGTTTGMLNAP